MDEQQRRETGRRIRQLRADLGLSQEELGAAIGAAKSTVSGFETGTAGISRVAGALAKALGTTTDYLLGLTENPLPPDEDEEAHVRDRLRDAVLEEFERLDEYDRRALYQIAVALRLAHDQRGPNIAEPRRAKPDPG